MSVLTVCVAPEESMEMETETLPRAESEELVEERIVVEVLDDWEDPAEELEVELVVWEREEVVGEVLAEVVASAVVYTRESN